jgi:uncharacterized Zn finger protein
MLEIESKPGKKPGKPAPPAILSNCPECDAGLAVLRVIGGRAGAEYWTMQCTECGGIHLDIVKPAPGPHAA